MADLPSYAELPVAAGHPDGSSWGLWGDDDVRGCLNLLTPERVRRGLECVKRGEVFRFNWSMGLPDPPLFNRAPMEHHVEQTAVSADDVLKEWNTQSSSQWDGFRHIAHPVHGLYNGKESEELGIDNWGAFAGRGVLADVARWREAQGDPLKPDASTPIEPSDVLSTLEAQGVEVEPGDLLCIRTGWMSFYTSLDARARESYVEAGHPCVGLRNGKANAEMLWDLHVCAVAADNPALEVWPPGALLTDEQRQAMRDDPGLAGEAFMHFYLLPLLGMPIGEFFDLDALAADCAQDGVHEFFFTSAPLNLPKGVASPPNVVAIK